MMLPSPWHRDPRLQRFVKDAAPLSFDERLGRMTKVAAKFNFEMIKMKDLAHSGGAGVSLSNHSIT